MFKINVELNSSDPVTVKKIDEKKDLYQISFGINEELTVIMGWTQLLLVNGISNKLIKEELT